LALKRIIAQENDQSRPRQSELRASTGMIVYGIDIYQRGAAMDSAKVFMTGRSQAVRLPKAYRFETDEVQIERRPGGALLLRPKPAVPLGERLRAILRGLPDDPTFKRPGQLPLERDAAWWASQGFGRAPARRRKARVRR
jgi:antitoxin VapB